MASVKREQILQEAEKLVARGKLDAAVKEYRRALDFGGTDTTSLNRLGDLLVRINRVEEAIDVYQRIAEHFADDGFFLKGIAIYKKINRLDPQRTEIYERLADLYFKQGLVVEGRQQLLTLSDWFLRSKQEGEAARVYRRLAELEPGNLQARAKLVDLLIQQGDEGEVGRQIEALTRALLGRGMLDEAIKLGHRALEVGSAAADAVAPCVEALVQGGRASDALELAEAAMARGATSPSIREVAALASSEAGDLEHARALLEELIPEVEQSTRVAQLYGDVLLNSGEVPLAKDHVLPAFDRLVEAGDRERASALIKKMLRGAPGDIEVLERALKVFDRRSDAELVDTLEAALADAYFRADRNDEARDLYQALQQREPENRLYAARLGELGVSVEHEAAAGAASVPSAGEAEEAVEFVDVEIAAEGPAAPTEADTARRRAESQTWAVPHAQELYESRAAAGGTSPEELYSEAAVFAKYGLVDKAVSHLRRLLSAEPKHADAQRLLAELGGGPPETGRTSPERDDATTVRLGENLAGAATPPGADLGGVQFDFAPPPAGVSASRSGVGRMRLEELEAILGFDPEAGKRLSGRAPRPDEAALTFDLGAPVGEPQGEAETDAAVDAGDGTEPLPEGGTATMAPPQVEAEEPVELVEVGGILTGPSDEQLQELDFFIEQGLRDDAARQLERLRESYADHPEVLSRQALLKARGWDEANGAGPGEGTASELFSEEEQFFDLAAELERELAEEEMVAEARGTATAQAQEASIEELFREFQRGVAEQLGEEDYDTHFNLGLAYREMGLLDEAIGEFQLAAKAGELLVESASMIGACLMDKGLPDDAIGWYGRALAAPDLPPEAEVGLRYELARAEEAAGQTSSAASHYAEVLSIKPGYRDVASRLERLRSN